ncbi:MAG: DUF2284 domain-containing protein [Deltaproteobacteria bacterium]|nr:DUF2284 domain-containing protein [Deltaproteobacteria bacterium]
MTKLDKAAFQGIKDFERHEATIPVSHFDFRMQFKDNCLNCPEYGKNLSCPPHSPGFKDFIGGLEQAKVICLRLSLDKLGHLPVERRARAAHDMLSSSLTDILLKERRAGYLIAGAGACNACRECPLEKGGRVCVKPEEQIFSLESLGVNISSLLEKCFHLKLEWLKLHHEARHICAVGALFFNR